MLHFFFTLIGSAVIAAVVGFISERTGFTRNGLIPSIIICIGGAMLFFFIGTMFRIGLGSPGMNAVVASIGALVIVPTHYRKR
jgi:uncharacterized membrane protein YeaQ/YmgE (transglycosylase-associated protein family)